MKAGVAAGSEQEGSSTHSPPSAPAVRMSCERETVMGCWFGAKGERADRTADAHQQDISSASNGMEVDGPFEEHTLVSG